MKLNFVAAPLLPWPLNRSMLGDVRSGGTSSTDAIVVRLRCLVARYSVPRLRKISGRSLFVPFAAHLLVCARVRCFVRSLPSSPDREAGLAPFAVTAKHSEKQSRSKQSKQRHTPRAAQPTPPCIPTDPPTRPMERRIHTRSRQSQRHTDIRSPQPRPIHRRPTLPTPHTLPRPATTILLATMLLPLRRWLRSPSPPWSLLSWKPRLCPRSARRERRKRR